jgi:radical SAM enzyme (TIGR01210 family)
LIPLYPDRPAERNRWVLDRRGPKNRLDPARPYAFLHEEERGASGDAIATATLFLTNRECPFRCLMCDLWLNTLDTRVPVGAIPAQIRYALTNLPPARQIKLYNAGSFFDPAAIPPEDYAEIVDLVAPFERVIVECHPGLVGPRVDAFARLLSGKLEVAIGLETVHPGVLDRLNKRFTVADFERAAAYLAARDIGLRVFLLVRPPFMTENEGVLWAERSLETAFAAGACICCLIPTRGGNGAMEALAAAGDFAPPRLRSLEAAQEFGLRLGRGRVFADTWDAARFFDCDCSAARVARLDQMNREQRIPTPIACATCGAATA